VRLVLLCGAWVAGVAAGLAWGIPIAALALFLAAALCLMLLTRLNGRPLLLSLALALLLFGGLRGSFASHSSTSLSPWLYAGEVQVEGVIVSDPEPLGTMLRFRLQVRRVADDDRWHEAGGDLLVTTALPQELVHMRAAPYLCYGDLVVVKGQLQQPKEASSDYREYLARRGIQALLVRPALSLQSAGHGWPHYALAYTVRRALANSLAGVLPEPHASVAQAILFGLRRDIPDDVNDAFQDTGTTHLLAVSGMNMMMVLAMALPLSVAALGRRRNFYLLLPLALLWAYAFLSGLSPSVVRAVLMASVYLAAKATRRPYAHLPAVSLAAALMTAQSPNIIYDLSFQLSFGSVIGILLLSEPLATFFRKSLAQPLRIDWWPGWLSVWLMDGAAVSLAASIATAPILVFAFQQVSFLSVLATLLALPVIPIIMATTFIAALGGMVAHWVGQFLGWGVWLPLSYLLLVVEGMAKLPFGLLHVEKFAGVLVWGSYGTLGIAAWLSLGDNRKRLRAWLGQREALEKAVRQRSLPVPEAIGLLSMTAAVAFAWAAAASLPDGKLHVTFLDVGQGDAILIKSPDGQEALIDGGPFPQVLAAKLGQRMPFWDRALELAVISHYHEDHLAGLAEALRRYDVALVLDNPYRPEGSLAAQWQTLAQGEGAKLLDAQAGQEVRLGNDVALEVLGPPLPLFGGTESDINNNSTVLRLRYREFSLLLPGDLAREGEALLVDEGASLYSGVLKVGHHGSATSSSQRFLEAVQPLLAIVSVGEGNLYGHPTEAALTRLRSVVGDSGILTTEAHGDIELTTDGRTLWVTLGR